MTSPATPTTRSAPRPTPATLPGYRSLRVWQRALDLAVEAARLAPALAAAGHDAAGADLFRAGAAVPAHIAAGGAAATRLEHQRVLHLALAAVARFETLVVLAERLAPEAAASCAALLAGTNDVSRQLRAFARAIGAPSSNPRPDARAHEQDGAREFAPAPPTDQPPPERAPDARAPTPAVGDAPPAPAPPPSDLPPVVAAPASSASPTGATTATAADAITPPMPARAARARRTRPTRG